MKNLFVLFTLLLLSSCSGIDYEELLKDRYGNQSSAYGCASYYLTNLNLFVYDSNGNNVAEKLPLTKWNVDHSCWQDAPYYLEHSLVEIHQYLDGDNKELPFYSTQAQELTVETYLSEQYGHKEGEKYVSIRLLTDYGDALDEAKEHSYKVTLKCLPLFGDEKKHEIVITLKKSLSKRTNSYLPGNYMCKKLTLDGNAVIPSCPEISPGEYLNCAMTISR